MIVTTPEEILQLARDEFQLENGRAARDAELVQVLTRWLSQFVRISERRDNPPVKGPQRTATDGL